MTNTICIDAGPVIQLVAFPNKIEVRNAWERWEDQSTQVMAPALLFYEVTNVLYRYRRLNLLSGDTINAALKTALALPIELVEDSDLHLRAAAVAEQFALEAAYDAHYLALAERLGIELWTIDQRLTYQLRKFGIDWVKLLGS